MAEEQKETARDSSDDEKAGSGERVADAETAFEEYTGENKCPECGEPIIDVRANCPNCGYEYQESDYGDKEAGSEFVAGSAVDDEGNEIPDDETGGAGEESEADDDEDAEDDTSDSEDSSDDTSDDG